MTHATGGFPLFVLDLIEDGVLRGVEVIPVRRGEGELLIGLGDVLPHELDEIAGSARQGVGDDVAATIGLNPPIVDHSVRHRVVVVRKERCQVTPGWPRDVVPQHIGAIAVNDLGDVRRGVVLIIGRGRHRQHRIRGLAQHGIVEGPVVATGVVEPHVHTVRAHCR